MKIGLNRLLNNIEESKNTYKRREPELEKSNQHAELSFSKAIGK